MKPFAILTLSVAAFMLSACGTEPQAQKTETPPSTQAQETTQAAIKKRELKIQEHTEVNILLYQCEQDIGQVEVRFFPVHGVAVLVLDNTPHELQQQRAASGFWYANAKYSFRGKGATDAWLEIGRRAPINCWAE